MELVSFKEFSPSQIVIKLYKRIAQCILCPRTVESRPNLKDFLPRPTRETDLYHCGCYKGEDF